MQNLIRVRVPDAAQDPRIRQGAFERTILRHQPLPELGQRARHDVDPARIHRRQLREPRHHVERSPPLRASLGHRQGAMLKVERRKSSLARQLRSHLLPVQPPGDHQVQHRPQVVLKPDRNPLAHPAQLPHPLPLKR